MKKQLLFIIISLSLNLNSFAVYHSEWQYRDSVNDGPYIFNLNGKLKVKWIVNSVLREDSVLNGDITKIKNEFNLLCNYRDLTENYLLKSNFRESYRRVDSISVISDIHGEYNIYTDLLKANGIIDKNLKWKYGKGHLVVLGDIFDRGEKVTEIFWHLFGLEKQAIEAGGMVHLLLGNHELMVLTQNLRYMNGKYKKVEEISGTNYSDLYSENSVLGNWLRSKPVMITINDIIFVHAGISIEMVQRNLGIMQVNKKFPDIIAGKDTVGNPEYDDLMFLGGNDGPLWYRGYFTDAGFNESRLDSILGFYDKKQIVVGHTSFKDIKPLFTNKIIGVDAGIMNKQPGEMLIFKNGFFYKGLITGKRIKL
jgi:hypothetical protein